MDMIFKILKYLLVIQVVSNDERKKAGLKKLGEGFSEAYRFNPYNPLSYLTYLVIFVVGMIMYGAVGYWKEVKPHNPFKWN